MPYYVKLKDNKCIEKVCAKKKPSKDFIKVDDPHNYEVECKEQFYNPYSIIKNPKYIELFTSNYGALLIEFVKARDTQSIQNLNIKNILINDLIKEMGV